MAWAISQRARSSASLCEERVLRVDAMLRGRVLAPPLLLLELAALVESGLCVRDIRTGMMEVEPLSKLTKRCRNGYDGNHD
jgi:hypothetical protein